MKIIAQMTGLALLLAGCAANDGIGGDASTPSSKAFVQGLEEAAREAERSKSYSSAAMHYGQIHNARPKDLPVLLALARNLRYAGGAEQASSVLEKNRSIFNDHPDLLVEWGKCLIAAKKPAQAVDVLRDAAQGAPERWDVYSSLGIAHDNQAQYARAQENYQKALDLNPGNPVILNNMAISNAQAGNLSDAIGILESAARHAPSNIQIRQNLALLYGINGDVAKAKALGAMDLDEDDVANNVSFYRRFEQKPR